MRKIIKLALCLLGATAFASQAQVIVNEDFSTYSDGDVNGMNGWVASDAGKSNVVVGGELMLAPNGDRVMFSGAGASLGYGDRAQITVDYWVRGQSTRKHSGYFGFGIQTNSAATAGSNAELINTYLFNFGLEPTFRVSGQMHQFPDSQQWTGPGTYVMVEDPDFGMNQFGYYTNVAPYDSASFIDSDSDVMRSVYTITKSHVSNEFNVAVSTSNLTTGATGSGSDTGIVRPDVWGGSNVYVTIYSSGDGNTNFIKSVKMEKLPPVIAVPTGVSALALDASVGLSWDVMPGATYDVYRSTTSGSGFSLLATVTSESYTDTSVVNGTTYYYYVIAKYSNGDSAASAEVSAAPKPIYSNAAVYSTDFSGIALGDLAADADWAAISGTSNNAFAVINDGGDNKADTESVSNSFNDVVGNGVYIDRLVRNDMDDVVEGSFDVIFSVSTQGTNDADHTHQTVMSFGLTSTTANAPKLDDDAMALFGLTIRHENRLLVKFGEEGIDENSALAIMNYDELGWNPKPNAGQSWVGTPGAIDKVTDPIHIDWKIRKTREDGVYQAWASVSNLTTGIAYSGNTEFVTKNRQSLYDAPAALFSMAHYYQAHVAGKMSTLYVKVDNVTVNHTTQLPVVKAPLLTSLLSGDREVNMAWNSVLDATGYSLFMTTTNGEMYTLLDNAPDLTYTDAPRWNDIANTYTLQADFDNDLVPNTASTNFSASPIGLVSVFHVNEGFGTANMDTTIPVVTNGTYMYMDGQTTPLFQNGVGGYTGPTVYGIMQGNDADLDIRARVWNNGGKLDFGLPTSGWNNYPYGAVLAYITVPDMQTPNSDTTFDATAKTLYVKARWGGWFSGNQGDPNNGCRIAIRNGTTWYVSDALYPNGGGGNDERTVIVDDVAGAMWRQLTINLSSEMTFNGSATAGSALNLTDVNAIGWFANRFWAAGIYEMDVQQLGAKPSYDYWADNAGLVSTNNAPTDDPDGDGYNNNWEYAFGGDPLVAGAGDTIQNPVFDQSIYTDTGTGDQFLRYVHLQQRDPVGGISYVLKTTTDLVNVPFAPYAAATDVGVVDYYWQSVTNYIPLAPNNETFIKVDVQ